MKHSILYPSLSPTPLLSIPHVNLVAFPCPWIVCVHRENVGILLVAFGSRVEERNDATIRAGFRCGEAPGTISIAVLYVLISHSTLYRIGQQLNTRHEFFTGFTVTVHIAHVAHVGHEDKYVLRLRPEAKSLVAEGLSVVSSVPRMNVWLGG